MIVTLTLNPSVDRTVEVEALVRGDVMRALGVRVDPGGKGINVSRALAAHGLATRAVVTLGGAEGEHLVARIQHGVAAGEEHVIVAHDRDEGRVAWHLEIANGLAGDGRGRITVLNTSLSTQATRARPATNSRSGIAEA
jgi:hypothetical protein